VAGAELPRDASRRGAKGPFQAIAGADAVKAIGRQHGFRGAEAADVVRAAVAAGEAGEPVLDELARRLALGVAATCVVLDPPLVVLAGEVSQAGGPSLAERVEREVAAITLVSPKVVITEVASEPVLHGALYTALDAVRDEVFGSTTA
jgi:predicted NBD/HSP70 family sugar kinase